MVRTRTDRANAAAAYTLVDLSSLDSELRKDIIDDANAGGGYYGVRVVEESVYGGARAPIYGVYNDGPDAERWAAAKKEHKISSSKVDDADVAAAAVEIVDPAKAAAIREAAAQRVEAEADKIRRGEDSAIADITGELPTEPVAPSLSHTANIVDDTLAVDATNEVSTAENQKPEKATKSKNPK